MPISFLIVTSRLRMTKCFKLQDSSSNVNLWTKPHFLHIYSVRQSLIMEIIRGLEGDIPSTQFLLNCYRWIQPLLQLQEHQLGSLAHEWGDGNAEDNPPLLSQILESDTSLHKVNWKINTYKNMSLHWCSTSKQFLVFKINL